MEKLTDEELYCLVTAYAEPPGPNSWVELTTTTLHEILREDDLVEIAHIRRPIGPSRDVKALYRVTEAGEKLLEEISAHRIIMLCLSINAPRWAIPFIPRLKLDELSEVLVHKESYIRREAEKRYKQLTKCPRPGYWRRTYERLANRWGFCNRDNASKTS